MKKVENIPNKKHFTAREVSELLEVSYNTVLRYIRSGVLEAEEIGDMYIVPRDALSTMRPRMAGRPRQSVPQWRFSHEENRVIVTTVEAELREGVEEGDFVRVLEQVKRDERYLFQGTIARYVLSNEETPRLVQFFFVWRQTAMPSATEIEQELAGLRAALSSVLCWEKVAYRTHRVWMHT